MKTALLLAVLGISVASLPAHAQATRTWVSGVGDDANPCSRTAPCKTFAGAISKTAASGEINVIDAGAFGSLTITKSITVNAEGLVAGVLASFTNGIIINAGANDIVVLRGLDIEGAATGLDGIRFVAGGALHVQKCLIRNFRSSNATGRGILFAPAAASELFVNDCFISGNGTDANNGGIVIRPTGGGSVKAAISRTYVENNTSGIIVDGNSTIGQVSVTIQDSVVAGNQVNGITSVDTTAGVTVRTFISNTLSANNGVGIVANGAGQVTTISNTTVSGNNRGLLTATGGALLSYRNNFVSSNIVSDGDPTGTVAVK